MRPPIPSPFGDSDEEAIGQNRDFGPGIYLDYRLKPWCVPRKILKESVVVPVTVGIVLAEVTIFAAILYPVSRAPLLSFFEFWVVCLCGLPLLSNFWAMPIFFWQARGEKAVVLTSYGVVHLQGRKRTEMPWRAFLFVLVWSGDVILVTLATGIFLPREVFASSEQEREFVRIARELRRSRGAAWRDEWQGFGIEPENTTRNLPK